jgi:hypothetical protein
MRSSRRPDVPIAFRSAPSTVVIDASFPAAVPGEDFDRYKRAVWRQGERWFTRNSFRVSRSSMGMHEARELLWSVASRDLTRPLNPQEERLLSEVLQQEWSAIERWPDDAEPEIPAFLIPSPPGD